MKEITCFNVGFRNCNKFPTPRLSPACTSTRSQYAHLRTREVDMRHSPQKQSTQLPGNISCKSSQTPPWRSPAPARWRSAQRLRPYIVALLQREVPISSACTRSDLHRERYGGVEVADVELLRKGEITVELWTTAFFILLTY
jgi:hypothetical protein